MSGRSGAGVRGPRRRGRGEGAAGPPAAVATMPTGAEADDVCPAAGDGPAAGDAGARPAAAGDAGVPSGPAGGTDGGETDADVVRDGFVLDFISGKKATVDMKDSQEPERFPPLCVGQVDLLADDVLRLLAYERHVPRSVLVEYLTTLFAFHLGLYYLRIIKLLPILVRRRSADPTCAPGNCPVEPSAMHAHAGCPYRVYVLVDLGHALDSRMADLARRSADAHYRRVPLYVRSQYLVRKLDEFAEYLSRKVGRLALPSTGYFGVGDLLRLLEPPQAAEREGYFKMRLAGLLEDTGGHSRDEIDPELARVTGMGLSDLDLFIEMLMALRGSYHRRYVTEFLDSLFKRRDAGMMHQSKGSARRFVLGSRLLEVLLQIAVLESSASGFSTRALRIDELLTFLRERYGIFVDRLPPGDGFGAPGIDDLAALRGNVAHFKERLREVGFFRDLSDAYVAQTITPRYTMTASKGGAA